MLKLILGWIIDTHSQTIQLSEHWQERLHEILASIPLTWQCTTLQKWRKGLVRIVLCP